MYILNVFPIQFLALFAYTILRLGVGFIFLSFAKMHLNNRRAFTEVFSFRFLPYGNFFTWYVISAEICIGTLFIFGFYTQIAALLSIFYALKYLLLYRWFKHPLAPTRLFLLLLLCASLSLFITGAGAFALDLPL